MPGFPIYESQIAANGAVPVPIFLRESREFAFDPAELEAKITPKTRLLILNTPHNPTGGMLQSSGPRRDRRDSARASAGLGVSRTRSTRASPTRARSTRWRAAGDAGAHDHLRRRIEDVGDDRLAHRLCRQPRAGARVHALDHQHRFLRVADLAMGGGRGDHRSAGCRRPRCAKRFLERRDLIVRPAERGSGRLVQRRRAGRSTRGPTSPRRARSRAAPIPRPSASGS